VGRIWSYFRLAALGGWTLIISASAVIEALLGRSEMRESLVQNWSKGLLKIARVKLDVSFEAPLPDGGCIFVFNHTSLLDIPVCHKGIPKKIRFGAKIELFKIPIFSKAMRVAGALPIARNNLKDVLAVYESARERVKRGECFILAPEGTRQMQEQIGAFKSGPFVLAAQAKCPVVPVVLHGVSSVLPPRGIRLSTRAVHTVKMRILQSESTEGYTDDGRRDLKNRVRERMIVALNELKKSAPSLLLCFWAAGFSGYSVRGQAETTKEMSALLAPQFRLSEEKTLSGFYFGPSRVDLELSPALQWGVKLSAGGPRLIDPLDSSFLQRDSATAPAPSHQEFGIIEAFAHTETSLGKISVGQIPIYHGDESIFHERDLYFPRSLIYQSGLVPLRSQGASYSFEPSAGIWTQTAVFEGVTDSPQDNRYLLASTLGWRDRFGFIGFVSGVYGDSTQLSRRTKIRSALAVLRTRIKGVGFAGQFHYGESDDLYLGSGSITSGHIDVFHRLFSELDLIARFDTMKSPSRQDEESTFGFRWSLDERMSAIHLWAIRRWSSPIEQVDDELRVEWRFSSVPWID